ncbi:MAG TPA: LLM class F420-dependent oxidoreductase [Microthrixaceae bacterium]|nr:LLM class F420-dependent oxidoreductase [Microthrixaceae bacterium]HMV74965.1 LLM class F420-dependent oxidoreductase [Microthrixaceae bacterium]HMX06023.1 LLM class F420-dependent oxidoreductase [Microthrixaceae bacterium]HMX64338.1 LLM class F420-dependent oxidoreductase [Microthrixaceae bacterium]HMY86075.1 LLM class F420-dependent oxidoreductase [Microthrixaceae bacterium]
MKLSMQIGYSGGFAESVAQVQALEKAGMDIVYVAEAYGYDAPTLMGYLAAETETIQIASGILPIYTRTPTLLAMTAAGLDELSGGRAVLGLGASGPQVIEGFHGVPYDAPIGRTREIIDICRKVWKREEPVVHDGKRYQLPLPEGQGTGLGKPLKMITHPRRADIPIHVASLGPKNVQMTAELADGWLPILFHPERAKDVWGADVDAGLAKRSAELGPLDVIAGGLLSIGPESQVGGFRDFTRGMVALYVGGMGARDRNFYNQLFQRYGYEAEAKQIQDLYLDGKKQEAAAAVPESFLEETSLCGDEGYVKDRIAQFKAAGVTVLNVTPIAPDLEGQQRMIAKVKELSA